MNRSKQIMLIRNRQTTVIGQMTSPSREFYALIEEQVRNSRIPELELEELLLRMGQEILEAQRKGTNLKQLFGGKPDKYIKEEENKYALGAAPAANSKASSTVSAKDADKINNENTDNTKGIKFNLMIAWAAVSMVFLLMGLIGQVTSLAGQDPSPYTSISLFTLALIAGGAIVLIQILLSFNHAPEDEETHRSPRRAGFNLKSIINYLIVVVIILLLGYIFGNMLPAIQLSAIALIAIGAIGLVLVKPIFGRKRRAE
ncbi:DUF1129 family protein [Paenibacillus shunpengii]|uniref:DUF1129 family protein n=1 Tax=Paenibacillus shunpengii TaxID=2054424 RepID=A0ABW5SGQ6_9BACL|nr:DUF1129 family protein [Paenibacillus sp. FSL H7-0326]OMC72376.1 hypothetical protein BK126_10440 [Paenibacillus sp. FSL H7-0326]